MTPPSLTFPPTYGQQLREARRAMGWTQKNLAAHLGIGVYRVHCWERYTYMLPTDGEGVQIEAMLGVPWPPQLLTYEQQLALVTEVEHLLRRAPGMSAEQLPRHIAQMAEGLRYYFPDGVDE